MKCNCCKREVLNIMGRQKYCVHCSLFIYDLKKKINTLTRQVKVLKEKIEGGNF